MNEIILLKNSGYENIKEYPGVSIIFQGENNKLMLEEGTVFHNSTIFFSNFCTIKIKKTNPWGIRNTTFDLGGRGDNKCISIGSHFSIESGRIGMVNEGDLSLNIGDDCMFSSNILIQSTDGHKIYSYGTQNIINKAKPIVIGDKVWIGSNCSVLKGSIVPYNTIIGHGSTISGIFHEKNTILAGSPAKVVKRNIEWSRDYVG